MHFEERGHIAPRWQGFMKQYRKLRGHKSALAGIHTQSNSQTVWLSSCCSPGWLLTHCIDRHFVARSFVYYQPSQTGLNLLFPLRHANRQLLLSIRLPTLPQMTRRDPLAGTTGPLTAVRPHCCGQIWAYCVFGGIWKSLKSVASDYSCMPWHTDVRFGDFGMWHRWKTAQTNKQNKRKCNRKGLDSKKKKKSGWTVMFVSSEWDADSQNLKKKEAQEVLVEATINVYITATGSQECFKYTWGIILFLAMFCIDDPRVLEIMEVGR